MTPWVGLERWVGRWGCTPTIRFSPHFCSAPATKCPPWRFVSHCLRYNTKKGFVMNSIIYLVGLVVIVMAVLSFVGLH
ncbi:MAG TPA: hypothetical protein VL133_12525 [Devosia sp.]|nr:hypothetical protein [Devosia sp.]